MNFEDCINFRYINKEIIGNGGMRTSIEMPNCRISAMALGACPENCSSYEAR